MSEEAPKTSAIVPINEETVEFTAGLLGGGVGFVVGGPVLGAVGAAAANYASKKDAEVGEVLSAVSKTSIEVFNYFSKVSAIDRLPACLPLPVTRRLRTVIWQGHEVAGRGEHAARAARSPPRRLSTATTSDCGAGRRSCLGPPSPPPAVCLGALAGEARAAAAAGAIRVRPSADVGCAAGKMAGREG